MSQEKVNKEKLYEKTRHKYVLQKLSKEHLKEFFGGGRKEKRRQRKNESHGERVLHEEYEKHQRKGNYKRKK